MEHTAPHLRSSSVFVRQRQASFTPLLDGGARCMGEDKSNLLDHLVAFFNVGVFMAMRIRSKIWKYASDWCTILTSNTFFVIKSFFCTFFAASLSSVDTKYTSRHLRDMNRISTDKTFCSETSDLPFPFPQSMWFMNHSRNETIFLSYKYGLN